MIDTETLKNYCLILEKNIDAEKKRFYRARISKSKSGFPLEEMGAPPKGKASDGRANAAGIRRLYLTCDKETTLHEIRAAEYDYVTIGTFKAKGPIKVVDLTQIDSISPFLPDIDCTVLAINREHLKRINNEMSKTMRRNDSVLDYLPTQYISDFIMSIKNEDGAPIFDGIEYRSAMRSTGANLAIFYPEKFQCVYHKTYEVDEFTYTITPVKNK